MSRLLAILLTVALASLVSAGGNPDARIYIDFDPPNYVHEVTPEPYTTLVAYVCMDRILDGVVCVSFKVNDLTEECPGLVGTQGWIQLFPGDLPIHIPYWEGGATVCSTECMTEDDGPVLVGYMSYLYIGYGSGCLRILDHPEYPRWVVDCSEPGGVDQYCVLAHGSINGGECPDGDCSEVPVRDGTWGTIKSLYR